MSDKEIIRQAVSHYGEIHQLIKALEEMGELIQAICKYLDKISDSNKEHIKEEVADVHIMCAQVEEIVGKSDTWVDYKLARLKERMDKDEDR